MSALLCFSFMEHLIQRSMFYRITEKRYAGIDDHQAERAPHKPPPKGARRSSIDADRLTKQRQTKSDDDKAERRFPVPRCEMFVHQHSPSNRDLRKLFEVATTTIEIAAAKDVVEATGVAGNLVTGISPALTEVCAAGVLIAGIAFTKTQP